MLRLYIYEHVVDHSRIFYAFLVIFPAFLVVFPAFVYELNVGIYAFVFID